MSLRASENLKDNTLMTLARSRTGAHHMTSMAVKLKGKTSQIFQIQALRQTLITIHVSTVRDMVRMGKRLGASALAQIREDSHD